MCKKLSTQNTKYGDDFCSDECGREYELSLLTQITYYDTIGYN